MVKRQQMAEGFQKLMKDMNPQNQETQKIPRRKTKKKIIPIHIIVNQ